MSVKQSASIRPDLPLRGPRDQILHQKGGGKVWHQKAGNGLPTLICRIRNAPRCLNTFRNAFLLRVRRSHKPGIDALDTRRIAAELRTILHAF